MCNCYNNCHKNINLREPGCENLKIIIFVVYLCLSVSAKPHTLNILKPYLKFRPFLSGSTRWSPSRWFFQFNPEQCSLLLPSFIYPFRSFRSFKLRYFRVKCFLVFCMLFFSSFLYLCLCFSLFALKYIFHISSSTKLHKLLLI